MHTKDANVVALIRLWAGTTECDNYKDMAALMASAIRGRAMYLEDATEFGRILAPVEASAIEEVKHHMPCWYNAPRSWWAWYNESCTGTDRG